MQIHQDALSIISAIDAGYDRLACVSLDHDLFPKGIEDAGDGMQVARHLAIKAPRCPVILHTSNSEQCRRMQGVLESTGWAVRLAGAIGEDWIEQDWRIEITRALVPQ